jgi:hypothetical protein
VKDVDAVLSRIKTRAFLLLRIYCLLFPYDAKVEIAQDALPALKMALGKLSAEEIPW